MNTKRFLSPVSRTGRKAACFALGLVLPATLSHAFISEDFESDTPGQPPQGASFVIENPTERIDVEVVNGANHHFPTGTQSLMLRNDFDSGTPIAGFAGSLPSAGIDAGSFAVDFYPLRDDATLPFPWVSVRLGNNDQSSAMGTSSIAIWVRTWRHTDGREFLEIFQPDPADSSKNIRQRIDVAQHFMNYNEVNSLEIDFANAEFEVRLNGGLLTYDGSSSFAMTQSLTHINHLNLVNGNTSWTGSEVYFDNLSMVPEPSTYALFLGLGVLGALGFRSRMRRSAVGKA